MNKDIIEKLYEMLGDNMLMACIPPAVEDDSISDCNDDLRAMGCPVLPDDYVDFLRVMDGFAFNGVELFSSSCYICDENYTLLDVALVNENFDVYEGEDVLLWIGRDDLDYYCYNATTGKYEIRDHESLSDVWDSYDTFEHFFVDVVMKRII